MSCSSRCRSPRGRRCFKIRQLHAFELVEQGSFLGLDAAFESAQFGVTTRLDAELNPSANPQLRQLINGQFLPGSHRTPVQRHGLVTRQKGECRRHGAAADAFLADFPLQRNQGVYLCRVDLGQSIPLTAELSDALSPLLEILELLLGAFGFAAQMQGLTAFLKVRLLVSSA